MRQPAFGLLPTAGHLPQPGTASGSRAAFRGIKGHPPRAPAGRTPRAPAIYSTLRPHCRALCRAGLTATDECGAGNPNSEVDCAVTEEVAAGSLRT